MLSSFSFLLTANDKSFSAPKSSSATSASAESAEASTEEEGIGCGLWIAVGDLGEDDEAKEDCEQEGSNVFHFL
jgi:hypothetical protein